MNDVVLIFVIKARRSQSSIKSMSLMCETEVQKGNKMYFGKRGIVPRAEARVLRSSLMENRPALSNTSFCDNFLSKCRGVDQNKFY